MRARAATALASCDSSLTRLFAIHRRNRVAKLNAAKVTPALAAAAPAASAAPAAAADLVPSQPEFLDPDLSLRELRVRLLSYGLSTTGLKAELRERLSTAMLMGRQQFKSWDPSSLAWK